MKILYMQSSILVLLISSFISQSAVCMEQLPKPPYAQPPQASWHSLPAEIKRYAMQFIASSNVYEVAETMKTLNATDRFCHAAMQSEQLMISIMQRMPYFANRTCLLYRLYCWPVRKKLKDYENAQWHRVRNGGELLDATRANNIERVKELLTHQDLQLNCHAGNSSETSLALALENGYHEIAIALIKAGATIHYWPLINPVKRNNSLLVALLLEFGADPNYTGGQIDFAHAEIKKLIFDALEKRKKRM